MSDFKIGEHEAMIRVLDIRTAAMATDIAEIKALLAERTGERRAVLKLAGVVSALVGSGVTLGVKFLLAKLSIA